jgi:hypothetical protein
MAQKQKTENELVASAAAGAAPRRRSAAPRSKAASAARNTYTTPQTESPAPSPVATSAYTEPTYDEIASLAYSYWVSRGCQGGSPEEDWLLAEQALRTRV